jgi:hypothetical protein
MKYNFTTNLYPNFTAFCKKDNDSFMGNATMALSLITVAARLPSCKDTSTTFSNNTVSIRQKEEREREKKTFLCHYPNHKTLICGWIFVYCLQMCLLCLAFLASAHRQGNRIHRADSVFSSEWKERNMASGGDLQLQSTYGIPDILYILR